MSCRPPTSEATPRPFLNHLVERILRLPRLARIVLALLYALAVTLVVSPVVDYIYLSYLFTPQTVALPALVAAGFGAVMYILGWRLIVGTVGEIPTMQVALLWYILIGSLALVLGVLFILIGVVNLNLPG